MPRLFRLIAANVALIPLPRHARRSSPRSAISVAQYGPAITRERSSTRTPSSIVGGSATIEEALRHRVDLRDAGARDRVDPRLDLGQRLEWLDGEDVGVGADLLGER